jgi:hypothetical protein
MNSRLLRLLCLVAALREAACIENRLSVDVSMRVLADGSCFRRTEYRLERFDSEKGATRLPIDVEHDPLRKFHRFPVGEGWTIDDRIEADAHTVVLSASLPPPNDIDWDYWRATGRRASGPVARNHVSFAMTEKRWEYAERFVDLASPLASARRLAQQLGKRDDEVKRAYRDVFAEPIAQELRSARA